MWRPQNLNCACSGPQTDVFIQSPTGRKFSITGRERETIETSWMKIADKETIGRDIFQHIFEKKPALKRLWGLDNEPVEALSESLKFQQHARNFTMFLDVAVRSLSLDGLYVVSLAKTVGKRHVLFNEVSFDAENWLLFKTAVMEALEPHLSSADLKRRWHHFIMFLVTEVKDAFNKEFQSIHSSPAATHQHQPILTNEDQHNGNVLTCDPSWGTSRLVQFNKASEAGEGKRKSGSGDVVIAQKRRNVLALRKDLSEIQNCVMEEENEF